MKSSKERQKEKIAEQKKLVADLELREKQLEVLSIEHEKLLKEYVQLHGAYTILQRSLKLIILDNAAICNFGYSHQVALNHQVKELDAIEIVVTDNTEEGRIEFKLVNADLINDEDANAEDQSS